LRELIGASCKNERPVLRHGTRPKFDLVARSNFGPGSPLEFILDLIEDGDDSSKINL
jgi:hypothetical protein